MRCSGIPPFLLGIPRIWRVSLPDMAVPKADSYRHLADVYIVYFQAVRSRFQWQDVC